MVKYTIVNFMSYFQCKDSKIKMIIFECIKNRINMSDKTIFPTHRYNMDFKNKKLELKQNPEPECISRCVKQFMRSVAEININYESTDSTEILFNDVRLGQCIFDCNTFLTKNRRLMSVHDLLCEERDE
jgi:hypothetical protein